MSQRKRVVVVFPFMHLEGERILAQEVDIVRPKEPTPEAVKQTLPGAHAIVARSPIRIGRGVLEAGTDLEVLSATGSGADCFDIAAATEMGLPILNSPGVAPIPVAEHTIGLMIALTKRIVESDAFLRSGGAWEPKDRFKGVELEGKTLGIVGLGHIGSLVTRKCRAAFNMRVLAYDPALTPQQAGERGAELVSSLADLFRQSDIVTVHVPLLPNTRGLIGTGQEEAVGADHLGPVARLVKKKCFGQLLPDGNEPLSVPFPQYLEVALLKQHVLLPKASELRQPHGGVDKRQQHRVVAESGGRFPVRQGQEPLGLLFGEDRHHPLGHPGCLHVSQRVMSKKPFPRKVGKEALDATCVIGHRVGRELPLGTGERVLAPPGSFLAGQDEAPDVVGSDLVNRHVTTKELLKIAHAGGDPLHGSRAESFRLCAELVGCHGFRERGHWWLLPDTGGYHLRTDN
ncbi:MAG: hypothetical protein HYX97_02415 [Chloroflexi bacterium]|nr:hypothetical protein [Chloroflexota bacterium]